MNALNILIICWSTFPFGSASSSRLRTFSKGLIENGISVRIITTSRISFRENDVIEHGKFKWNGIRYECTNLIDTPGKKYTVLSRLINLVSAVVRSWCMVKKIVSRKECDAVYIFGRSIFSYAPIAIIARRAVLPVFYDICEWFPASKYKSGFINPAFIDDYLGRQLPRFLGNGVIAITSFIKNKYDRMNVPSILIPSVYDTTQMQVQHNNDRKKKIDEPFVITYAGTCKPGDGFDNLIGAVQKVVSGGLSVRLDVVGTDGRSGWAAKYRRSCEKDNLLRERVRFLGRVSEEEYLSVLSNASCLVLPRPATQIARAAFPTRLPEFLATGRPVLTTSVPDVPLYLDAGVHAEIVDGANKDALAQGIIRLIKDPDRAYKIGVAGQQRCIEVFDYRGHIKKFSEFLIKNHNYRYQL